MKIYKKNIIESKNIDELKNSIEILWVNCKNSKSFLNVLTKNVNIKNKITQMLNVKKSFSETIYHFMNNLKDTPKCGCGSPLSYNNYDLGYFDTCGDRSCEYLKNKKNKSMEKTFQEKYGGHPMKTEIVKKNFKNSMIKKYGFDSITKYHVYNKTFNYSSFKNKDVKEKIKKTFQDKYGGHPMQNTDNFINNLKSRLSFKEYILPSGKKIKLQGYEIYGIEYLLKIYEENEIISDTKLINETVGYITYEVEGKKRKYYPDFIIKNKKIIYEIKSGWTLKSKLLENIEKFKSCEKMGYKPIFLIFNSKGTLIKKIEKESQFNL